MEGEQSADERRCKREKKRRQFEISHNSFNSNPALRVQPQRLLDLARRVVVVVVVWASRLQLRAWRRRSWSASFSLSCNESKQS